MERQIVDYYEQYEAEPEVAALYQTVLDALDDHITTDLSAEDLKNLSEYELTDTETLPGEVAEGERHDEFYVDEDALEQLIVELFYLPDQRGEE